MKRVNVSNQAEMDAAVAAGDIAIISGLWDNASAVLRGNASAVLWDNASAEGQSALAVIIRRTPEVVVTGGLVVDAFEQPTDAREWARLVNAVTGESPDTIVLYKRTSADYSTRNNIRYVPGTEVVAPDWDGGVAECGGGLHLCPHAAQCDQFRSSDGDRYVACEVALADIAVHAQPQFPDKVKARAVRVLYECNRDGSRIEASKAVTS